MIDNEVRRQIESASPDDALTLVFRWLNPPALDPEAAHLPPRERLSILQEGFAEMKAETIRELAEFGIRGTDLASLPMFTATASAATWRRAVERGASFVARSDVEVGPNERYGLP